jgi:hypothetical protein
MSSIWLSPALKPKSATQLGQRPTISTLSIIFGRCPRTKKEHKGSHQMQLACSVIHNDFGTAPERRALL